MRERACATTHVHLHSVTSMRPAVAIGGKGMVVTIYSQHPNRGKVQILATYRAPHGVVSSTVTSVDDAKLAAPIVDALNRISACATVPVSVYDRRDDRFAAYPRTHLAALTDRDTRAALLEGAHSLWYELVMMLLHEALADLDDAMAAVPAPIRTALNAELEAEAGGLQAELAEYSEGIEVPDTADRRCWDFGQPFVAFEGGLDELSAEDRDRMNRLEVDNTDEELQDSVKDLRVLVEASKRAANPSLLVALTEMSISDDPHSSGPDRYFLNIDAPSPWALEQHWSIDISEWDVDLDEPGNEDLTSTGEMVLRCAFAERPTADDIVKLLDLSGGNEEQLAAWAKTPVGEPLAGTGFVVTERF